MHARCVQEVRSLLSGTEVEMTDEDVIKYNINSRSLMFSSKEDIKENDVDIVHNASSAFLVEAALREESNTYLTSNGALSVCSGAKTGRSPKDKRIVCSENSEKHVWWGPVNIEMDEHSFMVNRERAIDYLNTCKRVYVVDGYAGWDKEFRVHVRVICERPYHALFMHNMLINPSDEELDNFTPEFIIINAGRFPANRYVKGTSSSCAVNIHLERFSSQLVKFSIKIS